MKENIPLSFYNPASNHNTDSLSMISGILIGSSREEVLNKELLLRHQGLI